MNLDLVSQLIQWVLSNLVLDGRLTALTWLWLAALFQFPCWKTWSTPTSSPSTTSSTLTSAWRWCSSTWWVPRSWSGVCAPRPVVLHGPQCYASFVFQGCFSVCLVLCLLAVLCAGCVLMLRFSPGKGSEAVHGRLRKHHERSQRQGESGDDTVSGVKRLIWDLNY